MNFNQLFAIFFLMILFLVSVYIYDTDRERLQENSFSTNMFISLNYLLLGGFSHNFNIKYYFLVLFVILLQSSIQTVVVFRKNAQSIEGLFVALFYSSIYLIAFSSGVIISYLIQPEIMQILPIAPHERLYM